MSLTDGTAKMSKSNPAEGSRINVLDTPESIAKKIKHKTDAVEGLEFCIASAEHLFLRCTSCDVRSVHVAPRVRRRMRWGDSLPHLTEAVVAHLEPIQKRYEEIVRGGATFGTTSPPRARTLNEAVRRPSRTSGTPWGSWSARDGLIFPLETRRRESGS